MPNNQDKRSTFAAIVGRANVGKSSLLNNILGQKIAIVSSKPQTTRTRILGVMTKGDTQLVFIDTPGMHKPKTKLGDYMIRSINACVAGVDIALLVVEAGKPINERETELIDRFKSLSLPAILAINKIDLLKDKTKLIEQIAQFGEMFDFEAVVPVSAKTSEGLEDLISELREVALPGAFFFDEDTLTDQPERAVASEIIREKMLRLLDKEVPHGVAVAIEGMKERNDSSTITDIDATIICEKDSHKGIIIGKNAAMLKRIGTDARVDLEKFFNCKINLQLWVKVKKDWRNKDIQLRNFGFDKKGLEM